MAEFNYAEELNTNVDYDYITDVMTGEMQGCISIFSCLKVFKKRKALIL